MLVYACMLEGAPGLDADHHAESLAHRQLYIYAHVLLFFGSRFEVIKEKQMTQISSRLVNNMQSPPVLFSRIPPLFLDENVQSDR